MPSHRVHRALYPFKVYPDVDSWMDEPSKWLGPNHRKLRHSVIELYLKYPNDWGRIMYGMYHIMLDGITEEKALRDLTKFYDIYLMMKEMIK